MSFELAVGPNSALKTHNSKLTALPDDPEPLLLRGRLFPLHIDVFDARRARAAIAPADHAVDRGARALEHRLDTTIVHVAHPALNAGATGMLLGRCPKIDPLHSPANCDMRSHPFHRR